MRDAAAVDCQGGDDARPTEVPENDSATLSRLVLSPPSPNSMTVREFCGLVTNHYDGPTQYFCNLALAALDGLESTHR